MEKIVNSTSGNGLGIYDCTIFGSYILRQARAHLRFPHLINPYYPGIEVNGFDPLGLDGPWPTPPLQIPLPYVPPFPGPSIQPTPDLTLNPGIYLQSQVVLGKHNHLSLRYIPQDQ